MARFCGVSSPAAITAVQPASFCWGAPPVLAEDGGGASDCAPPAAAVGAMGAAIRAMPRVMVTRMRIWPPSHGNRSAIRDAGLPCLSHPIALPSSSISTLDSLLILGAARTGLRRPPCGLNLPAPLTGQGG